MRYEPTTRDILRAHRRRELCRFIEGMITATALVIILQGLIFILI